MPATSGWTHSAVPIHIDDHDFRVPIGGPDCKQPADILVNISDSLAASLKHAILASTRCEERRAGQHTGEADQPLPIARAAPI
ncbi:MAG: hypothetical protein R3D80_05360 [Paracoccaceae bacterium]